MVRRPAAGSPGRFPRPTRGQLLAANSRVSELDLINELYRGRLTQLEQDQANGRGGYSPDTPAGSLLPPTRV